ncbi:hypothetical protein AALP_AA7G128700 [Arabis alpina]|uniref:Uncharacterized protein n=1 Tax=Arabis alpina TaxID=50452 RepID=A0A087GHP7_ARAAL|nr:hypothetical protein AALP_AA7G128700 [Arabis alpina]
MLSDEIEIVRPGTRERRPWKPELNHRVSWRIILSFNKRVILSLETANRHDFDVVNKVGLHIHEKQISPVEEKQQSFDHTKSVEKPHQESCSGL